MSEPSTYKAALKRIEELEEKRRFGFCIWCGHAIELASHKKEEVLQLMKDHEFVCSNHPLQSLTAKLARLEAALGELDDYTIEHGKVCLTRRGYNANGDLYEPKYKCDCGLKELEDRLSRLIGGRK